MVVGSNGVVISSTSYVSVIDDFDESSLFALNTTSGELLWSIGGLQNFNQYSNVVITEDGGLIVVYGDSLRMLR
jgi:outer membrane protein assembly factor BamB